MTELRKGQRLAVDATVISTHVEDADAVMVRVVGDDGFSTAVIVSKSAVHVSHPTYLARREAMVRSLVQTGQHIGFDDDVIAARADALLRAIDETPVPEWAGGEHE